MRRGGGMPKWKRKELEHSYRLALSQKDGKKEGVGCMTPPRAIIPMLDCYFCGELVKMGYDFREMAAHVMTVHFPMKSASQNYKEQMQMSLPRPTGDATKYAEFLKGQHFNGEDSGTLTLLGAREAPQESFSDLFVDVKLGGKQYTWGLKADSRNYAILYDRFGRDEKKWKGRVNVALVSKGKNIYINVID